MRGEDNRHRLFRGESPGRERASRRRNHVSEGDWCRDLGGIVSGIPPPGPKWGVGFGLVLEWGGWAREMRGRDADVRHLGRALGNATCWRFLAKVASIRAPSTVLYAATWGRQVRGVLPVQGTLGKHGSRGVQASP